MTRFAKRSRTAIFPSRIVTVAILGVFALASAGVLGAWSGDDETTTTETAILAGGCFWGMEGLIRDLDGVVDTEVGYAADQEQQKGHPSRSDPHRLRPRIESATRTSSASTSRCTTRRPEPPGQRPRRRVPVGDLRAQ